MCLVGLAWLGFPKTELLTDHMSSLPIYIGDMFYINNIGQKVFNWNIHGQRSGIVSWDDTSNLKAKIPGDYFRRNRGNFKTFISIFSSIGSS